MAEFRSPVASCIAEYDEHLCKARNSLAPPLPGSRDLVLGSQLKHLSPLKVQVQVGHHAACLCVWTIQSLHTLLLATLTLCIACVWDVIDCRQARAPPAACHPPHTSTACCLLLMVMTENPGCTASCNRLTLPCCMTLSGLLVRGQTLSGILGRR
jgi:hypothetical protein